MPARRLAACFLLAALFLLPPFTTGALAANSRTARLDVTSLRRELDLALAPAKGAPSAARAIVLPMPDGSDAHFRVSEASIFGAEFQRAHPELRTYRIRGIDDPVLSGCLDLTPNGIRVLLFTPAGMVVVDPVRRGRADLVTSAFVEDGDAGPMRCVLEPGANRPGSDRSAPAAPGEPALARPAVSSAGDQLRTYRFILMATGEYTVFAGGPTAALAEMTTAMNRNNAIFERETASHFEVVGLTAFPDPATDPYPMNTTARLLVRNASVVDSLYGATACDLTQVLSVTLGYEGRSFMPTQCYDGFRGESSVTGPDVRSTRFEIKVMPHEIGHAMGTTHSQDDGVNRAPATAVEPGDGWTIMTSPGDPASFGDSYFHAVSLEQIDATLADPPGCLHLTPTGNTPPTADAGPDVTIPRGTPFVLTGSGSDPDAGDVLTYTWDEMDAGPLTGDATLGPLFRWRLPTTSPERSMPALATVLSGAVDPLEKLPSVDRLLHFRLVVRDNHPGAGGHAWDDRVITVSGAPFAVTSPNGGELRTAGVPFLVTWSVGGSVASNVNIQVSFDGGAHWGSLAASTPNDGSEPVVAVVGADQTQCRIRLEAVGNIFYDVSNADFTILGDPTPTLLSLLEAAPEADGIAIRWRFADPSRFDRVEVERADSPGGGWSLPVGERTSESGTERFVDRSVEADRSYQYRLRAVTLAGADEFFGPIEARAAAFARLSIDAIRPNPAAGAIRVDFAVPRAGRVQLRVLDVQGRLVETLIDGERAAGSAEATWAGPPRGGAGLYFVRLEAGGSSVTRRFLMVR